MASQIADVAAVSGGDSLVFRIASVPCGASDAFMHPACAYGLDNVEYHEMTVVDLLDQQIVYCDSCGERILPKGVSRDDEALREATRD